MTEALDDTFGPGVVPNYRDIVILSNGMQWCISRP